MPVPVIVSLIVGSMLFGLFYLANLKLKVDYIVGVYGIAIIILGVFVLLYFPDPNNLDASLVYTFLLVVSVFALLGYVTTWYLIKGVFKK